jgi:DNA-binding Xre family transcriptional regulator
MDGSDARSDEALLLAELKGLLRDRRIRYGDIAERLQVSQATVKRYLAGRGLTLGTLEAICGLAGVRLTELSDMAARRGGAQARSLTPAQEQGLAEDLFTAFVFMLLRHGWSPQQVQAEFALDEPGLVLQLRRLEGLRLIDLFPGNRVRLLTVRDPSWVPGGPLRRVFDSAMRVHFEAMDFHDPHSAWELETVKLSPRSIARMRELIAQLAQRLRELAAEDHALPAGETEWYTLLTAARPFDPRALWEGRRKP